MSSSVLIAGGGVAGLEAALALRDMCGDRVEVEICSPREEFIYRPFAVGEPYGTSHPLRYGLEELAQRCGAVFRRTSLASIDTDQRLATTPDGQRIAYDHLILASGVKLLRSVPGAVMFWGTAEEPDAQNLVRQLGTGDLRRLGFAMPAAHSWSLPLYELALLADARLSEKGRNGGETRLAVVTPEEAPLAVFGRQASDSVGELLEERGIEVHTGVHPVKFEGGLLSVAPGDGIEADAVISLPRMEGRRVPGIPFDEDGFIPVDDHGKVIGAQGAYAAGDVTSFPVKQGGIASQQADAVAEAIAAELGCEVDPEPFDPILRGVLWTGAEPRYLYGRLSGGRGETSAMTDRPPWPEQEGKIMSRYLSDFLAELDGEGRAGEPA
jgi:sulfide:quinone oxidoreductase